MNVMDFALFYLNQGGVYEVSLLFYSIKKGFNHA